MPPNDDNPTPVQTTEPPRPIATARRRRWWRRIGVALLIVLVLAIGGVQLVLMTQVPRNLVISELERELGLRVSTASLSSGWLGNTTLQDVTLSLPLASEAF